MIDWRGERLSPAVLPGRSAKCMIDFEKGKCVIDFEGAK
jgi:hypothetical protein